MNEKIRNIDGVGEIVVQNRVGGGGEVVKATKELDISGQLTDYGKHVDFKKLFDHAVGVFSQQAMSINDDSTLSSIELAKAKAASFNESIQNIMTLSHDLEIMSADSQRFRRADELAIINTLRVQCQLQSEVGLRNMQIINRRLIQLEQKVLNSGMEDEVDGVGAMGFVGKELDRQNRKDGVVGEEFDPLEGIVDEIQMLQDTLAANIASSEKIISSVSKLIQLERQSGNRPWGRRDAYHAPINYIQELEGGDGRIAGGMGLRGLNGGGPTRRISMEDLTSGRKS